MTTERNAQGVDGLAEVMGLLGKATPGDFTVAYGVNVMAGDGSSATNLQSNLIDCMERNESNAAALVAAVNYLRSHDEAIRELVEAAKDAHAEYRKLRPKVVFGRGAFDRLRAALAKFPEPRP